MNADVSVRFFSAPMSEWKMLSPPQPNDEGPEQQLLKQHLRSFLGSPNVAILSGLGTSLCIRSASGATLAPTMADLWASITELPRFDDIIKLTEYDPNETDFERFLSRCQLREQLKHDVVLSEFIRSAETLVLTRCRFVEPATKLPTHELFLRKIARRSVRHQRARIFTTNYDLAFETAAARSGFIVIDGFSHSNPQRFDGGYFAYDVVRRSEEMETPELVENVFHLYKLHGSVDWNRVDNGVEKNVTAENAVIVYPRDSKYQMSYEQPFLEMLVRFQLALRQPNTSLLIAGFGFRDAHIVQPVLSALRSNVGLRLLLVDPEAETSKSFEVLRQLIHQGDVRVAMVGGTFESLAAMLPDALQASEEEEHAKRMGRIAW